MRANQIQSNDIMTFDGRNVPVTVAARIMGKTPMFVRVGLQRGLLPFGVAYKTNEEHEQFDYYISPRLFADFTGCSIHQCVDSN